MRLFTRTLASGETLDIDEADGVTQISIQAKESSAALISGDFTFKGLESSQVTLQAGQSFVLTSTPNSPISGISIECDTGTIDVAIGF